MMKQLGMKRGLKRHRMSEKIDPNKCVKKDTHIEEKPAQNISPIPSEDLSKGHTTSREVVQNESSVYDSLLMTLQSWNKSLADVYKERGGRSDSEEEDSGSLSMFKEEDASEEGTDNEFSRSHVIESKLQEPSNVSIVNKNEDAESGDDHEESDTDQEHNLGVNAQNVVEASLSTSSFHEHLGYKLSEGEIDNLLNKKWEYKWNMTAFNQSNCKWVGTGKCFLKNDNINPSYGLKQRLYEHWLDAYKTSGGNDFHSSKQRLFFSLCNSYRDILHCNKKPFYCKGLEEDSRIMDAYLMHSLNHIFRTRDLIKKNDSKVAKHQEGAEDELLAIDGFRDHGFTRPKVLILLPYRNMALRVVRRLIQLTPQTYRVNVEHADRFYNEFGTQDDDSDEFTQNGGKNSKPSDHQALFSGNCDDEFMIGIKFTRRSIKLYSDFYSSDMIVASPLHVHNRIAKATLDKEIDVDFLSSIEVLVIDHADVISMQNWNFLSNVLEHLNRIPSKQHGTDIMRIRKWYLDGNARFYRQTIILGHYANPDINASFNHKCVNYQGKVKLVCKYKGVLSKVLLQVRQIYERFDAKPIADVDDARLEYFIKKVFPKIKDSTQGGIMLFISSYFEYVRLRNYMKSQNASFCAISDYTKPKDVSRPRVWFFEGKKKIMLYTERIHFYHRYKIRGIKNLIIYSLPDRKEFYPEVVNMLEEAHNMTCTVLFSQFDILRLERIVGTVPARRMVASEKNVFLFC